MFAYNEPGIIDYLVDEIDFSKANLVFSSFDPFPIADAWFNGLDNIFYCNLFWYWDVFKKKDALISYKKKLELYKNSSNYREFKEYFGSLFANNSHDGIFLGYIPLAIENAKFAIT